MEDMILRVIYDNSGEYRAMAFQTALRVDPELGGPTTKMPKLYQEKKNGLAPASPIRRWLARQQKPKCSPAMLIKN
jgi:hypothetical protein